MITKLRLVNESRGTAEMSVSLEATMECITDGCNAVLWELEAKLARCRSAHGTLEDVTNVQREIVKQVDDLNSVLETVRR